MKKIILSVFISLILFPVLNFAQSELGLTIGATNFWGELGGANRKGRSLFWDTEIATTRPVLGIMYRYNMNQYTAMRVGFYWGNIAGDDALIKKPGKPGETHQWYRWNRDLNFKSYVLELSAMFELNFSRFEIGRRRYRFAPYGFIGVGGFAFNPKGKYNGSWVRLQPLGTEGQGINGTYTNINGQKVDEAYPKKYSLVSIAIPLGLGIKYNLSREWTIGFEYGHRITFTDYIDDVSNRYPDINDLNNEYGGSTSSTAQMIVELSGVTVKDPDGDGGWDASWPTSAGQQRGDYKDKDHYIFAGMVTITYTVKKGRIYCPKF